VCGVVILHSFPISSKAEIENGTNTTILILKYINTRKTAEKSKRNLKEINVSPTQTTMPNHPLHTTPPPIVSNLFDGSFLLYERIQPTAV
jgi:hypothetical protein